jgi:alpha-ketoglutaric semialdehyde dehydrogenase
MSINITSVIAGLEVPGAPGGRLRSVNPARTAEAVAETELGDAGTFAAAARAARAAQRSWADVPRGTSFPPCSAATR